MTAQSFILKSADVELAANDGTQQGFTIAVEQVEAGVAAAFLFHGLGEFIELVPPRAGVLRWPRGTPGNADWPLPAVRAAQADCRWFSAGRPIWFRVSRRGWLLLFDSAAARRRFADECSTSR